MPVAPITLRLFLGEGATLVIVWNLWKPAEGSRRLKQFLKTTAACEPQICVALPAVILS